MWGRTGGVPSGAKGLVVRYGYKEWVNMGCFGNAIVVSGSVLCNILYCIVVMPVKALMPTMLVQEHNSCIWFSHYNKKGINDVF